MKMGKKMLIPFVQEIKKGLLLMKKLCQTIQALKDPRPKNSRDFV